MKNIDMQVKGDKLVITIDLSKEFGASASGKTTIVATTAGNVSVPGREAIKLGINAYKAR
jgi:ABC-type taurine transport system ATPase subunit